MGTDRARVEKNMSAFQAVYTDIEPNNLKPEILSYAENTQWVSSNKIAKRFGILLEELSGIGYLKSDNPNGLNKAEILSALKAQKRFGNNIYTVFLLREKQPLSPSDPTGFLYIEITNATTGALVSSVLHAYNQGGSTRNQQPTSGKIRQFLNYIFIADGSVDKIFYIDLTSSETTTAIVELPLNSTVNSLLTNGDVYTDVDIHVNKLFVSGSLGKVAHSNTLDPLNFTATNPSNAGIIEYKATSGVICNEITPSFLGLLVSSENLALNQFNSDVMTGTVPFDITINTTQERGFKVESLSDDVSFISGSILAIDNNLVGLTQAGVMDLRTLTEAKSTGEVKTEDTLSFPLGDIIRAMNKNSDAVTCCKNPTKKRYYLSVPLIEEGDSTKFVYVYDYQYKQDIPRWSIWKLEIDGVGGLYTIANEAYVADLTGNLYKLETGSLDAGNKFYARIESAGVGGDTKGYEKQWPNVAVTLKSSANNLEKVFRVYSIGDEYYNVNNAYNDSTETTVLHCDKKFDDVFNRLFRFDRARRFDDDGFGQELFFLKNDLPRSKTLRVIIDESKEEGLDYIDYWELVDIYVQGYIENVAVQAAN